MKRAIFVIIPFILSACDSSYSVDELKKDKTLMTKIEYKCNRMTEPSDGDILTCDNLLKAKSDLFEEEMDKRFGKDRIRIR